MSRRRNACLTSKQDLPENISGNDKINSDKKRLDGQIEQLLPKSTNNLFRINLWNYEQ